MSNVISVSKQAEGNDLFACLMALQKTGITIIQGLDIMVRLKWEIKLNGTQLGKTNDFVMIDGTKYFNRDYLVMDYLKENDHHTEDEKGRINYYDIVIGDEVWKNGAWYYANYKTHARDFSNFVAFSEDVELSV